MTEQFAFDKEIGNEVIDEALESLESTLPRLTLLGKNPKDLSSIDEIFRCFHSIKGNSGMVGLTRISGFTHGVESALDKIRKRKTNPSREKIALLVEGADLLTKMLESVDRQTGAESVDSSYTAYLDRLTTSFTQADIEITTFTQNQGQPDNVKSAQTDSDSVKHPLLATLQRFIIAENSKTPSENPQTRTSETDDASIQPTLNSLKSGQVSSVSAKSITSSLRVEVARLDSMAKIGGELFHINERLKHLEHRMENSNQQVLYRDEFRSIVRDFEGTMDNLYGEMQSIRRVPVLQVTRALERIVRDACRVQGKQINLVVEGEKLLLDKEILECLQDPLVHLIRNAIDHGIEIPQVRQAAGKREEALIIISVQATDENVIITISDDGKGIDLDKVRAKAVNLGLISSTDAHKLNEQRLIDFIFQPGFSTAAKVSAISGRGVGLDVVMSNLHRMGGSVKTLTKLGQGTTFTLELPKTVSPLMEGLVIQVGHVTYLLPLKAVKRLSPWNKVEIVPLPNGQQIANLDGNTYPIVQLSGTNRNDLSTKDSANLGVIIRNRAGIQAILPLDEVIGQQKVLVGEVSEMTKHSDVITGAFLMGDGSIGFAVSVEQLLKNIDNSRNAGYGTNLYPFHTKSLSYAEALSLAM